MNKISHNWLRLAIPAFLISLLVFQGPAAADTLTTSDGWTFEVLQDTADEFAGVTEYASIKGYSFPGGTTQLKFPATVKNAAGGKSYPVRAISDYAFQENKTVQSIVIPKNVEKVGTYAFRSSYAASLQIEDGVKTLGQGAFSGTKITKATLPDSVTSIGSALFDGCTSLGSVTLSKNIKAIPSLVFENTRISEIVIPDGVTSIGSAAFNMCYSLTRIKLPAKLTKLGSNVFMDCSSLASISIPEGITEIQISCFNGCSSLTRVLIPASVTSVYDNAFANCTALKDFVFASGCSPYISNESIGYKKTGSTTKYADITLWASAGSTAEKYAQEHGFLFRPVSEYTASWSETAWWDTGSSAKPAAVGAKVVSKSSADKSTYKVTSSNAKNPTVAYTGTSNASAASITVPKTVTDKNGIVYKVTKIEKNALKGNKKVKKLTIGANVTEIGASAFQGMIRLETVDFSGSKVKTIGKKAFYGCKVLKQVKANGNTLTKVGAQSFKGIKKKAKILIFAKNKNTYNKVVKLIKNSRTGKVSYVFRKKAN